MKKNKNKSKISGKKTGQEEKAMGALFKWVTKTDSFRPKIGKAILKSGYFANVLDLGNNFGLAISADGVGTKMLVAEMMNKYDTIGIDCIAMNVNDIICVGAEPLSMLDYLAVQKADPKVFGEIGKGLYEGAKLSRINIPGGEVAQIKEMVKGYKDDSGVDIAGTCVGAVPIDKIIIGRDLSEDDVIIGIRSSGIHSNGLTLARNILFNKMKFKHNKYFPELKRTLGEELLEPTQIYVAPVMEILRSKINVKSLANITGDGLLNITRVSKKGLSFVIEYLPELHPIFRMIKKCGNIPEEEMYKAFNMSVGFCITVANKDRNKCLNILKKHKLNAFAMGYIVKDREQKVIIEPAGLIGKNNRFYKTKKF